MLLVLPGSLPGHNEYIKACRANKYAGAEMKKDIEEIIQWEIKRQIKSKFTSVRLVFDWYERNRKRDKDNISLLKSLF